MKALVRHLFLNPKNVYIILTQAIEGGQGRKEGKGINIIKKEWSKNICYDMISDECKFL